MEPSGDELDFSVIVHVSGIKGQQMRWVYGQDAGTKITWRYLLKTNYRKPVPPAPVSDHAHRHNVKITVSIDISDGRAESAGEIPQTVILEIALPVILQPLYPVPRPGAGNRIIK